jgi:hypothetical protein
MVTLISIAGSVQKYIFSTCRKVYFALSEFDDEIIVVLDKVSGEASVTVPIPTSNSPAEFNSIA